MEGVREVILFIKTMIVRERERAFIGNDNDLLYMCYWYLQRVNAAFLMKSIFVTITIWFVVGLCNSVLTRRTEYIHQSVKRTISVLVCIIMYVNSIFYTAVGLIRIRHVDSDNRKWLSCVFSASLETEGRGQEITPWIDECEPIASQLIRPLRVRRTPLLLLITVHDEIPSLVMNPVSSPPSGECWYQNSRSIFNGHSAHLIWVLSVNSSIMSFI